MLSIILTPRRNFCIVHNLCERVSWLHMRSAGDKPPPTPPPLVLYICAFLTAPLSLSRHPYCSLGLDDRDSTTQTYLQPSLGFPQSREAVEKGDQGMLVSGPLVLAREHRRHRRREIQRMTWPGMMPGQRRSVLY